jgi:DNA-binding response OmpR family regulator
MLTGATRPEDVQTGFREGVTDYITKPFSVAQLRARLRSWLTRMPVAGL